MIITNKKYPNVRFEVFANGIVLPVECECSDCHKTNVDCISIRHNDHVCYDCYMRFLRSKK